MSPRCFLTSFQVELGHLPGNTAGRATLGRCSGVPAAHRMALSLWHYLPSLLSCVGGTAGWGAHSRTVRGWALQELLLWFNRQASHHQELNLLWAKGKPQRLATQPGSHGWRHWDNISKTVQRVKRYLQTINSGGQNSGGYKGPK